jgi:hypothetical protein
MITPEKERSVAPLKAFSLKVPLHGAQIHGALSFSIIRQCHFEKKTIQTSAPSPQ